MSRYVQLLTNLTEEKLGMEYGGIVIPDEYVVGYGLDYNGLFRNLLT